MQHNKPPLQFPATIQLIVHSTPVRMSNARKPASARNLPTEIAPIGDVMRKLPRGSSSLPKDVVQHAQRIRLFYAIAHCVADKGYADTTMTDITRHAGVSRTTFYELFTDKEHCFLEGFRIMSGIHMQSARSALETSDSLADRSIAALKAYNDRIVEQPMLAKAFIVEAQAASPAIRQAMQQAQTQWAEVIKDWLREVCTAHNDVAMPTDTTVQMVVAGMYSFAVDTTRVGGKDADTRLQALTRFTWAALGLYGWASRLGAPNRRWGSPAR